MGRKMDLSGLTDDEAEHVLKVVQRDMKLRKKEEERLSELKQELAEEGSRCSILSKQHRFNEHCCIRCCTPFTFLLNPKRQCLDCQYNVCKTCCTYSKKDKAWLCSACQKGRIFRTQSLEWYYNNVKSRFKRFGSAKVLKTLYRKHIIERGALSDLPESSVHEGSTGNDNDGSICGSDSAFYKQSEGHSMAETLTVALRVAEEAIEEAITKAEEFSDSLEKQNEARYLRDHKEELIEELATTIVQKIIQRRKRSEMQTEYDFVWPQPQPLIQPGEPPSPSQPHSSSQGPQDTLRSPYTLLRSQSAFSLTSDDSPEKGPDEEGAGARSGLQDYTSLKREGKATSLPSWKSVDRLDNSSASSVLQSPDGNWIALHSSQLSRPSLLTKRKSLVFSVLEKESGVVSAYAEMGSDSEEDDEGGWGAALRQFRRKLSDETYYTDSQHDPEWTYTQHLPITSPSSGQYTNTETLNSDSEASSVLSACPRKPPHNLLRKKGPTDTHLHPHHQPLYHQYLHQNFSQYPLHSEAVDVNFNPKVMGDSSEAEERQSDPVRRSRRRRKSKRESATEQSLSGDQSHAQTSYTLLQENSDILLNVFRKRGLSEEQPVPDTYSIATAAPDAFKVDAMTLETEDLDTLVPNSVTPHPPQPYSLAMRTQHLSRSSGPGNPLEEELQPRLSQLFNCANSKDNSSSEEECTEWPADKQADKESDRQREKSRPIDTEIERKRVSETVEQANGQVKRSERLIKSPSVREEGKVRERRLEKGVECLEEKVDNLGKKRGDKRKSTRQSKRQHKRDTENEVGQKEVTRSGSSASSPAFTPSSQEGVLSDNQEGHCELEQQQRLQLLSSLLHQKYSAASLCSITTEVLKVLNATEELIGEAGGESYTMTEPVTASPISRSSETHRLDQRLTKMEENVYLAAGAVYGLEGALGDLEQCARSISSGTTNTELSFLEDQVATAAAQVQQSELQISNIEARISALKTAGLNVTVCNHFSKYKPKAMPQTLDSSRHQRRKLPAPPLKEKLEPEQQVKVLRP
ncbi:Rab effector MyRIP Exophilin-8 Myosin VIIa- and Rab-interacting protein [Channa argus]|uniref:Rab effector MyRIP Exophilin-8 Myosin VIIa-and Rab-interacting protein n=1 Tax=Channa argus TaxID=215402 RepID=A0A6G1QLG9_CHAAH|nr:Rab effector MyRIP Exophilin-8 Myosin VIIa- and Rab-interacting protein [Channa argus]